MIDKLCSALLPLLMSWRTRDRLFLTGGGRAFPSGQMAKVWSMWMAGSDLLPYGSVPDYFDSGGQFPRVSEVAEGELSYGRLMSVLVPAILRPHPL